MVFEILEKFQPIIQRLTDLEKKDEYDGAFLFGSLARGDAAGESDVDANIITRDENPNIHILHPYIAGVKLDLTFLSYKQLATRTKEEEGKGRIPMVAESVILFDKTGELTDLKDTLIKQKPPQLQEEEYPDIQFQIHHANEKVERNLDKEPRAALLAMHVGVNELLKFHYKIHGKWWVSNKRLMADLEQWDPKLLQLLESFLCTCVVQEKYTHWTAIIDYILAPIGGRQNIDHNPYISKVSEKGLEDLGVSE